MGTVRGQELGFVREGKEGATLGVRCSGSGLGLGLDYLLCCGEGRKVDVRVSL